MKKLLLVPLLAVLLLTLVIIWFYINAQPVNSDKGFKNFLITKGSSASQIGAKLESEGFVKNALVFKIYLKFTGRAGSIQTGEFRLTPSFSLFQTVDQLFRGPEEVWVVIPEGLRREEIAARFTSGLERDATFTAEFLDASKGKEGTLFPDSYLFPKDVAASTIVAKMVSTFESKTVDLKLTNGLAFDQSVILASILERETKTDAERPVVSGILMNRLNAGMPLQVDASVQYAVGTSRDWWPILSLADLKINSAYNTYEHQGLPPAPIANPGFSSLRAAFDPSQTDYFYYIHDSTGQIHYAKTLVEHNANVAKYLKK
jgi:UPF0755 protein